MKELLEKVTKIGFWNQNRNHVIENQGYDSAIFGPFLNLQEFLKNRGLTFETSNFDFRNLLEELFHMI